MSMKSLGIWILVVGVCAAPVWVAVHSPLLQYRQPVYIGAGFAGIVGLICLLFQPLLIAQALPLLNGPRARQWHQRVGMITMGAIVLHVVGLWITSPPDVVGALLLRSATPFSIYGVLAMWAVFVTAAAAVLRKRLRISPQVWRLFHGVSALVILGATVIHVWMIEGPMGVVSKAVVLCAILAVGTYVLFRNKRTRFLR